uniref:G-patch domain-containing protein n=1 Tax=Fagus sylvatica TaxID=28930 RepID=A0A2N9FPV9_FAGSY
MAEEASKLRGLEARVAALETKFNFLLQFMRRMTKREEEKKKAAISKRQKEIYPALSLSKKKMITPVGPRTRIGPQPKDYNRDLTCEYHQGEVRHMVEICRVLRHRIQDLLDQGVLKFWVEGIVNAIGVEKSDEVDITSTKIPWEPLFHELKKRGLLTVPRAPKESAEADTCKYHSEAQDHNLQDCEEFKKEVASLITRGLIRRRREQPEGDCMTIDQLRLSPHERTNFQARMDRIKEDFEEFCEKKKEELGKLSPATPQEMPKPDPVVIQYAAKEKSVLQTATVSTIQSSEKVPSVVIQVSQPFPYQDNKRVPWNYGMKVLHLEELEKMRKEMGKAVEDPVKTKAAEDEAADFLRIIKSSEYSVVKQLSKMPSHISVLSLLLASESHRKALLKVLNEAYVSEDITRPSFKNMVTSILVTNQLTFSNDELPPGGKGHIKALYISVKTNDRIVSKVLIDNGSALNVCPLSTLEKLDIDPTRVRVTSMVVRAFDGTHREGDHGCTRPEQYPSSLHQKMKLIIGNQLVTILAEEPISIYNDGAVPYIDGCASEEVSFHSFEFVTVIHRVAAVEPKLSKAGIMVAREFVKARFQPGQGLGCANQGRIAIVTLEGNKDGYGLGYTPTRKDRQLAYEARRQRAVAKLRGEKWPEKKMVIPHIRTTFPVSAMFQVDEGDEDELALLFTEDLSINVIATEGDSTAPPIRPDQYKGVDLEDFLDEEDLKGYHIEEETLDEDTRKDTDFPNLLPHLMVPRRLETLEFEMFCEHGDPESHLRRYRKKMALYTDDELLMTLMFHESLLECVVTWFYQLKNITCWKDLARAFLDRYRCNLKMTTPPSPVKSPNNTTTAEEVYDGPMVEGLSINAITEEGDSTTPPIYHCQQGEEAKMWTSVPLLQRISSSNE